MDPLDYLFSLEKFGIKFGLDNIRTLTAALGNPERSFTSVLVAGTNGKGSVTAMVDHALRASGLAVGRYTSPHLVRLEERFAINGIDVDTRALTDTVRTLQDLIDRLLASGRLDAPPTFFEVTTAAAFELFRKAGVDVAVLEVGLGGRLDSTNVVEPAAAAITSIDFDHEQYLGGTLEAIAAEKAGVIRPGIPVVVGALPPDAYRVIEASCRRANALLVAAQRDTDVEIRQDAGRLWMRLATPVREYGWIQLGLRGIHQAGNARVAVRLLEKLGERFPIAPEAIIAGLTDVRWPGRLQMVESAGRRVLLDAAHNPAGAEALARYLKDAFPDPMPLVFGAMQDKNAARMLQILLPAVSSAVMTEPPTARAAKAEELAAMAQQIAPGMRIEVETEPAAALMRAWGGAPLVCAAGSIFLVGSLLDAIGAHDRGL